MPIPRSVLVRVEHPPLAVVPARSHGRHRVLVVEHGPVHPHRDARPQAAPRPVVHARQAVPGRHVPAAAVAGRRRVVDVRGRARLRARHVHGRQRRGLRRVVVVVVVAAAAAVVAQRAGRHEALGRGGARVERVARRRGLAPW